MLLVPFFLTGAIVFGVLQSLLLKNGVMNDYGILGSPIIVTAWLIFSILVFAATGNSIPGLLKPKRLEQAPVHEGHMGVGSGR